MEVFNFFDRYLKMTFFLPIADTIEHDSEDNLFQ